MKHFLRTVTLVIMSAIVLFSNPISTYAATIDHVEDYGDMKHIFYSPYDLLIINSGSTARLENTTNNGNWYFEGNGKAQVGISMITEADFNVTLYKVNSGPVWTYNFEDSAYVVCDFGWIQNESGNYMILIEPLNSTAVIVDQFYVLY